MYPLIASLILIGACSVPLQPARAIHLIYVEPPGETFTVAEQAEVRASATAALDFWQTLARLPLRSRVYVPVVRR